MSRGYGYGMFQQQAAKLHMTPQLQQAIRILQLPTADLLEHIRQELEANPVLEAGDMPWTAGGYRTGGYRSSGADPLQWAARQEQSLEKHLMEQLGCQPGIPRETARIIAFMIGNLDPGGYLEMSLDDLAESLRVDRMQAEQALQLLQGFEPAGVGARDLAECLRLQAEAAKSPCPELVFRIIRDHLKDIAEFGPERLAKRLQVSRQEIQEAVAVIRSLDPKPGASYQAPDTQYIVPDVVIEKAGDQFNITVLETAAPRLSIQEHYRSLSREAGRTAEERKFLSGRLQSASFLIRCIEQRRMTLLRVTRAIVEEQEGFFRHGIARLKPMILNRIADKVGLHESTVSRAAAGKFALTPWGIFELGYFFPSGFNKGREDAASAEHVKEKIKDWVKKENGRKPYSDRQLADLLAKEGIPVARRTVMKYREELGIASSVRRKARF